MASTDSPAPTPNDDQPDPATGNADDAAGQKAGTGALGAGGQEALRDRLTAADMDVEGRMPWSSNATFLVHLDGDEDAPKLSAIYKPLKGERPLWDFPEGLYQREAATYELSASLGFDAVPLTVVRDGPYGIGSVQRFVEADYNEHYFTQLEDEKNHDQLRTLCLLDLLANQTDRKGGHCLLDHDGHIWGIDNGLSFHAEFKVRTVIWDFAGEAIDRGLLDAIEGLLDNGIPDAVSELITDTFEREALMGRARALLAESHFPHDPTGHRYPWPMV